MTPAARADAPYSTLDTGGRAALQHPNRPPAPEGDTSQYASPSSNIPPDGQTIEDIAARQGGVWLDERFPAWVEQVTRPIRVESLTDCPLAQAAGTEYTFAYLAQGLTSDLALWYGFVTWPPHIAESRLNAAWEREVTKRRRGTPP